MTTTAPVLPKDLPEALLAIEKLQANATALTSTVSGLQALLGTQVASILARIAKDEATLLELQAKEAGDETSAAALAALVSVGQAACQALQQRAAAGDATAAKLAAQLAVDEGRMLVVR